MSNSVCLGQRQKKAQVWPYENTQINIIATLRPRLPAILQSLNEKPGTAPVVGIYTTTRHSSTQNIDSLIPIHRVLHETCASHIEKLQLGPEVSVPFIQAYNKTGSARRTIVNDVIDQSPQLAAFGKLVPDIVTVNSTVTAHPMYHIIAMTCPDTFSACGGHLRIFLERIRDAGVNLKRVYFYVVRMGIHYTAPESHDFISAEHIPRFLY